MIKNILGSDFKYEDDKMYRYSTYYKKWYCCSDVKANSGYIRIGINKKNYLLHRLIYKYHNEDFDITDNSSKNQIDHFDINPTNNKIENLRIVNHSQNMRNKKKRQNCSSKYRGVCWHKKANKWCASIHINNKLKHLGLFYNEEEASKCYKKEYDELMNF
jgi:hypothetical protein